MHDASLHPAQRVFQRTRYCQVGNTIAIDVPMQGGIAGYGAGRPEYRRGPHTGRTRAHREMLIFQQRCGKKHMPHAGPDPAGAGNTGNIANEQVRGPIRVIIETTQ